MPRSNGEISIFDARRAARGGGHGAAIVAELTRLTINPLRLPPKRYSVEAANKRDPGVRANPRSAVHVHLARWR